ncbi:MAG TPA: phosphoenolpyruvate carboxykinase (ATP), partial [Gemmatimonadales bacterium]|nr:phosphoenolpyruvate carboxykinase (ATP) [Gemmatimonadales bacterium]
MTASTAPDTFSLAAQGLTTTKVWANLRYTELYEHALRRQEGQLTSRGAFVAMTAPHTGRSPNDKFVVEEPTSAEQIWWDKNRKLSTSHFEALFADIKAH